MTLSNLTFFSNRTESSRSTKIKAEAAMKRKELYSKLDHQKKKVSDMQKQMSGEWSRRTVYDTSSFRLS